jgi:hypothetical protein
LAIAFLGLFLKAGINEFEISIKFNVFLTRIDIFPENCFGVIIALFANFKCKCEKTVHFQHFAKSKKLFLPISITLYLIPINFEA